MIIVDSMLIIDGRFELFTDNLMENKYAFLYQKIPLDSFIERR